MGRPLEKKKRKRERKKRKKKERKEEEKGKEISIYSVRLNFLIGSTRERSDTITTTQGS